MAGDNTPNLFGLWLRGRRRDAGITQDDLAERVGCSLITLQKIEAGERRPSRQMALLLANHLNIPSDEHEAFVTFARTNSSPLISEGTEASQSPWRTSYRRHINLPVALTPLLGRSRDEAAILDLLLQSRIRLVTLVGPPGVGKTRLSIHVAFTLSDTFEDGVFFVDLSPVLNPNLVTPTIARALGLRESPAISINESLAAYLSDKKLLIILDNFEQVLDAAPDLAALLQSCPWLKVLVTSREALHIRGERRYIVSPLDLPDPQYYVASPASILPNLDALASNPSIELFIERAQEVDQSFDLDETNARDIAAICAGLDGLPLAIELAAARADSISPADMHSALDSRLQLLSKGARDLPSRQRTLRNAIEWSYSLLSPNERLILEQTSVFAGGFTLESAAAVSLLPGNTQPSIQDHLSSLISKSLLQRHDTNTDNSPVRFRYLETLRDYASERLEQSSPDSTRLRHAEYFVHLAKSIAPRLISNEQAALMAQLLREHDNIRAALSWSLQPSTNYPESSNPKFHLALRLSSSLWRFWLVQGFVSEGYNWLHAALTAAGISPDASPSPEDTASLQHHPLLPSIRQAFYGIGVLTTTQGNFQVAIQLFNRSMELAHLMGNPVFEASALAALSNVYNNLGDYAALRDMRERELVLRRAIGEPYPLASCLLGLCEAATLEGDFPQALNLQEEAVAIFRSLNSKEGIGRALSNLGDIQLALHDFNGAWQTNQELLAIARELDQNEGIAFALRSLGEAASGLQRYPDALNSYRESLLMFKKLESRFHLITCISRIAEVYQATGRHQDAALLQSAIHPLRQSMGVPERSSPTTVPNGTSLTLEEAIAIALSPP